MRDKILSSIPDKLPLLLSKNDVLLPTASMRIPVNSSQNINMVKSRLLGRNALSNAVIGVISRKDNMDFQAADEGSVIGTAALVVHVAATNWPQHQFTVVVSGLCRFKLEKIIMDDPYPVGIVRILEPESDEEIHVDSELTVLIEEFRSSVARLLDILDSSMPTVARVKKWINSVPISSLCDLCVNAVSTSFSEKLDILNALDIKKRFQLTLPLIERQLERIEMMENLKKDPNTCSTIKINYIPNVISLNKIKNERNGALDDITELQEKVEKAKLPAYAHDVVIKDMERLKKMGPFSPEYSVIRSYIELVVELPWSVSSSETIDVKKARKDLDEDHYAMIKVKERVLGYLAVRQLKNNLRGPILCFVGPPGVGKTSIGRSIARTLGREFHRICLGGVHNQAEIRGHRRTYIGAMPGRIIQALKTVGTNNPVILLDEIDKVSSFSVHGDPAAALLEVLDPEQNSNFVDHYVNLPFDLSKVMFIATANDTKTIPAPLLDRMEVIRVSGYTQDEKQYIAERHLLPKQLKEHGLDNGHMKVPMNTLRKMINLYTQEAGVRTLERKIGALCRAVAVKIAEHHSSEQQVLDGHLLTLPIEVDEQMLEDILGPPVYDETAISSRIGTPGVAVGLAWTPHGGSIMVVEASKITGGTGKLVLTGHLGKVMKESAQLALNWVRTAAYQYNLIDEGEDLLNEVDIHIHFPEGAVGKEGPSAGVTTATALLSLFAGIPVARDVALTGEITLLGVVLPVGGVKEKVLAAYQAGLMRVILPKRSRKDLVNVPDTIKNEMTFVFVSHMDEVINAAFDGALATSTAQSPLQSKL